MYNIYHFNKAYLDYFISEIKSNAHTDKKLYINDIFELNKFNYDYNKYSFFGNEIKQITNNPKLISIICSLK